MTTLTVTSKGQVTLRRDVLQHLGVSPGEKITVDKLPDGRIQVAAAKGQRDISEIFGMLKRPGQPTLTIEELNEVIADSWAGKRGPWPE